LPKNLKNVVSQYNSRQNVLDNSSSYLQTQTEYQDNNQKIAESNAFDLRTIASKATNFQQMKSNSAEEDEEFYA